MPPFPTVDRLADQRDQRTEGPGGESRTTTAMLPIRTPTMTRSQTATRSTATTIPPATQAPSAASGPPPIGTATSIPPRGPQRRAPCPMAGTRVPLPCCTARRRRACRAAPTPPCGARRRPCSRRDRAAGSRRSAAAPRCHRCQRALGGSDPAGRGRSWVIPAQPAGRRTGRRRR
jgi:hypothetical protein